MSERKPIERAERGDADSERKPWRKYVDGCPTCDLVKANDGFGPPHNASPWCKSGKHPHCTCDTCF